MMYKKGSTQIVHFMTPGAGILMLGHGHISHIVNMYYLLLYQYTAHWLKLCLGIMMLLSYTMVDFHLFYDGAVDIQIWALLTRSQCKASDTQVTVKACWPLVFFLICLQGLIWLIFLYSLLLKPLSGEDSQGKINLSILTLWVTQVPVGIQSITLDLLCNYALLNVGIQTCVFLTFFVIACVPTVWR